MTTIAGRNGFCLPLSIAQLAMMASQRPDRAVDGIWLVFGADAKGATPHAWVEYVGDDDQRLVYDLVLSDEPMTLEQHADEGLTAEVRYTAFDILQRPWMLWHRHNNGSDDGLDDLPDRLTMQHLLGLPADRRFAHAVRDLPKTDLLRLLPDIWVHSDAEDNALRSVYIWREAVAANGGKTITSARSLAHQYAHPDHPEHHDHRWWETVPDDPLTIFRGLESYEDGRPAHDGDRAYPGLSWTVALDVAKDFAFGAEAEEEREPRTSGVVVMGEVARSDVLAFLCGRNEYEVVVDPKDVSIVEAKPVIAVVDMPVDTMAKVLPWNDLMLEWHVEALAESMRREGWKGDPLQVWFFPDVGLVTAHDGQHRTEAARRAGLKTVPAIVYESTGLSADDPDAVKVDADWKVVA